MLECVEQVGSLISSALSALEFLLKRQKEKADPEILRFTISLQKILVEIQSGIGALQEKVFGLQKENLTLQQTIMDLKEEKERLRNELAKCLEREKEREKAKFVEIVPGLEVVELELELGGQKAVYHLCPNCYQKGRKSFLRKVERGVGFYIKCLTCDFAYVHNFPRGELPLNLREGL